MSFAEHNLVRVGQVLKTNGTDGEIVAGFRDIDIGDIDLEEPVFIFYDETPVPFFIERLARKGNAKAILKLSGIDSGEDAEEIAGKAVFTDKESLGETESDEEDLSFLTGWTLYDNCNGDVKETGTITDYLDIPGNPCIEAETKNGAVTIPLHEDLIVSVDPDNRTIVIDIPDGLLDL